jgi:hypothetical protein
MISRKTKIFIKVIVFLIFAAHMVSRASGQCRNYQKVEVAVTRPNEAVALLKVELRFRDKTLLATTQSMDINSLEAKIAQMGTLPTPRMVIAVNVDLSGSNQRIEFSILKGVMVWEVRDTLQTLFLEQGLMKPGTCIKWTGDFAPPKKEKDNASNK